MAKSLLSGKAVDAGILRRIFSYTSPYKKNFYAAVFTTITLAFLSPLRPYLIQYTLDHFVATPDPGMLLYMTMILVGLLITECLLQFADSYLTNLLGQNIIRDLRTQLYRHITSLRLKYYDNTPIGVLVTRAVSDIEVIADIFAEGLIVILGELLKLSVILGVMLYMNFSLTLVVLAPVPLLVLATWLFKRSVSVSFKEVRAQVAKLNAFTQEHITGMNIIQIFNREEEEMRSFDKINRDHRDANIRSIMAYSVFFPVVEILSSLSLALLVWWGGRGVLAGISTLGELVAYIMFVHMLFRPIRQLADRFNTLQMGMVSSERVFSVLDTDEKIQDTGSSSADDIRGEIEFRNVWFAYNENNWVLKDISFRVPAGSTIALVGATGAGKSSVINLLSRFYEYDRGSIEVDGKNIREYRLDSLRRNIGVVLQDVFLFSDTIYNNITLNNPDITRDAVIAAAKKVGAHDFIERLPGGYDFNVRERGGMLSLGQRQVISFIRAYVYDPAVLVLDEATSSIDTESEQLIRNATEVLTKGRTSVVIAHRLATIQQADIILVMEKGEIVERGHHQELLAAGGHYRRLFDLQFKNQ